MDNERDPVHTGSGEIPGPPKTPASEGAAPGPVESGATAMAPRDVARQPRSGATETIAGAPQAGSGLAAPVNDPPGRQPEPQSAGKELREWLQFALSIVSGVSAVFVFVVYDRASRALNDKLTAANTQVAAVQVAIDNLVRQKTEIELRGLKDHKIGVTQSLRIMRVAAAGRSYHRAHFEYVFQNNGGEPIEVSNVLIEIYDARLSATSQKVMVVNKPFETGDIHWTNIQRNAHVIESQWKPGFYVVSKDPFANGAEVDAIQGGGGTGILNQTESSQGDVNVILPAGDADLVSFVVTVTLDKQFAENFGLIDSLGTPLSAAAIGTPGRNSAP